MSRSTFTRLAWLPLVALLSFSLSTSVGFADEGEDKPAHTPENPAPEKPGSEEKKETPTTGEGAAPEAKEAKLEPLDAAKVLAALDANGDNKISAEEIKAAAKALLALDKNKDGALTSADIPRPTRMQRIFSRWDKDKDGKIAREELPEQLQDRFDTMDANGDGYIDAAEQEKAFAGMRGMRGGRRGAFGGGGRRGGQGGGGRGRGPGGGGAGGGAGDDGGERGDR